MAFHEDDISAQKAFTRKGSRLQSKDEYQQRKKSFSGQTCKRKKKIVRLGHRSVAFFFGGSMKFSESLKKNRHFQFVYGNGKSYADKYLVMYVKENGTDRNRIGISVSKKVGNSVVRHRVTRLVRESYRLHEAMFNSGLDIVVVARKTAASVGYSEIEEALLHLGKLHRIIKV